MNRAPPLDWVADEGKVDLHAAMLRLWSGRLWIAISIASFAVLFGAVAFMMTPVYRATTVLVPASSDSGALGTLGSAFGQLGGLASLVGINVDSGSSRTQEALAVLRSRTFTEAFIVDERLMPALFSNNWDPAANQWRGEEDDWPTLYQAFRYFHDKVRTVTQDSETGLVTLEIEWRDPVQSALWANLLVARLNAEMRGRAIASTNASMGFLEKTLATTSTIETRQAINRLMEAQINQRMLANVTQEYVFRVADAATPPDRDEPVRPNKIVLLLLGSAIGAMFGALVVLLFGRRDAHGAAGLA